MVQPDDDSTNVTALNKFSVSTHGAGIRIMAPLPETLSKHDALNLAHWLRLITQQLDVILEAQAKS